MKLCRFLWGFVSVMRFTTSSAIQMRPWLLQLCSSTISSVHQIKCWEVIVFEFTYKAVRCCSNIRYAWPYADRMITHAVRNCVFDSNGAGENHIYQTAGAAF